MIDPLIKIRKTEDQPAENWYDDPWDSPDALHRSDQLEVDELPNDFRELSRPFLIVAAAVMLQSWLDGRKMTEPNS